MTDALVAPTPPGQPRKADVRTFHATVHHVLTEFGYVGDSPPILRDLLLRPWNVYRNLLQGQRIPPAAIGSLRAVHYQVATGRSISPEFASGTAPVLRPAEHRLAEVERDRLQLRRETPAQVGGRRLFRPPVETPNIDLCATTAPEFMAMLRLILRNSGRNANQLAKATGIATSTVYHVFSPKNTKLPKKAGQVRSLMQQCGLTEAQVRQVLELWADLGNADRASATTPATSASEMTNTNNGAKIVVEQEESGPTVHRVLGQTAAEDLVAGLLTIVKQERNNQLLRSARKISSVAVVGTILALLVAVAGLTLVKLLPNSLVDVSPSAVWVNAVQERSLLTVVG